MTSLQTTSMLGVSVAAIVVGILAVTGTDLGRRRRSSTS
jgi:hypothetical protein